MAKPIPDGYTAVTPYLLVRDVRAEIDFLTRAFGATLNMKMDMPDGTIGHADMSVFGSHVMMGQGSKTHGEMPAMIHLYVQDCVSAILTACARHADEPGAHIYNLGTESDGRLFYNGATAAVEFVW